MTADVLLRWATGEEMKRSRYIEWSTRQEYSKELRDYLEHLHNIKHPETVTVKWKFR